MSEETETEILTVQTVTESVSEETNTEVAPEETSTETGTGGLVTRDNRKFETIYEQEQRQGERIVLAKQKSGEVLDDIDELLIQKTTDNKDDLNDDVG